MTLLPSSNLRKNWERELSVLNIHNKCSLPLNLVSHKGDTRSFFGTPRSGCFVFGRSAERPVQGPVTRSWTARVAKSSAQGLPFSKRSNEFEKPFSAQLSVQGATQLPTNIRDASRNQSVSMSKKIPPCLYRKIKRAQSDR